MKLSGNVKSNNIPYYQKPFEGPHISIKDAIAKGLTKYFEGKTCSNGHIDFRWVSGGCNSCLNERRKNLYRRSSNTFHGPHILSYGPYLTTKQARDQGLNITMLALAIGVGLRLVKELKKAVKLAVKILIRNGN